ncbi:hypothetical protein ACFW04_014360 [Cataglyphis niger]
MPLDRSPIATPSTSASIPSEEFQQHLTNNWNLFVIPVVSLINKVSQMRSIQMNFLKLWFAQLESEFTIFRICSDDVKYSSVIRYLPEQALLAIAEIIENPPEKDKHLHIKNILINRFTDSEEKRLRQLLKKKTKKSVFKKFGTKVLNCIMPCDMFKSLIDNQEN